MQQTLSVTFVFQFYSKRSFGSLCLPFSNWYKLTLNGFKRGIINLFSSYIRIQISSFKFKGLLFGGRRKLSQIHQALNP